MVINRWQATYYLMTYLVIKGHKEAQEITLNRGHHEPNYLNPISHKEIRRVKMPTFI
jgi:hypothetical protein